MENLNFHQRLKKEINLIDEEYPPSLNQSNCNGRCFFCRRLITSLNGETFCLQNLWRFLKTCDSVRIPNLQKNMTHPICNECLKHHTTFTDLYKELELVTFRLNACIHNILGRMEMSSKNFRDDQCDEEESEPIRIMRQETISMCQKKVRILSHLPRVKLKRLHVEDIPSNIQKSLHQRKMLRTINEDTDSVAVATNPNPDEQELACPYFNCRAKFKDDLALRYHHLIYHPEHFFPSQLNSLTITYKQFQQILGDLLFQKFIGSEGVHNYCSICSKQFRSSSASFNLLHLKMHLVQIHHSALEDELEGTLKDSNLNEELSSHNSTGYFCPCGVYMADEKQTRLLHESSHCSLKSALLQNQSLPASSPAFKPTNIKRRRKISAKLAKPLVSNGTRATSLKDKERNLPCVFPTCRGLIAPEVGLAEKRHGHFVNHHCAEYYFSGCRLDKVTPEQFQRLIYDVLFLEFVGGGNRDMCTVCSKIFNTSHPSLRLNAIKAHLIIKHQPILKERLLELQKIPDLQQTLDHANSRGTFCDCGSYLPHQWFKTYHRENLCHLTRSLKPERRMRTSYLKKFLMFRKSRHGPNYSCPYCLDEPSNSTKMEFHMIWHHCEYFFSNVREEYKAISQEQFQRTVTDLLFKDYTVEDANGSCGLKDSCTLCNDPIESSTYSWKVRYIKIHMIRNHKPELDEKLRNLMDKPNLAELLAECNPNGMVCQCGSYLPNKKLAALHVKRLCKFKLGNRDARTENSGLTSYIDVKMDTTPSSFQAEEREEDPIDPLTEDFNQMPSLFNNDVKSELTLEDVAEMPELELEVQGNLNVI